MGNLHRTLVRSVLICVLTIFLANCGSDSSTNTNGQASGQNPAAVTDPVPSATPVAIPTATPVLAATPSPSPTPVIIPVATPTATPIITPTATPIAPPVTLLPLERLLGDCYTSDLHQAIRADISVNGHKLNSAEAKNVQWLKKCVLPYLPGTLSARVTLLGEVSWWSLREGVLELSDNKLFRYSLCHDPDGVDRSRSTSPMYDCGTNIWQVGVAAGQSINYTQAVIDQKSLQLLIGPLAGITQADLLKWTASLSGFGPDSEYYNQIVSSTLRVRRSWFVRNPMLGVMLVRPEVEDECLSDGKSWCFSGAYPQALNLAHTRADMLKSIEDLKQFYLQ